MVTTLLIDGDILVYRTAHIGTQEGFNGEKYVNERRVEAYIESLIEGIKQRLFTKEVLIFLSGKENFRKKVVPTYKLNRKDIEKPLALDYTYEYLINHPEYMTIIEDRLEADDLLGIYATDSDIQGVVCSIDKDLNQIPGYHYNWKNDVFYVVDSEEAYMLLWRQILAGDPIDGYKGVPRIGPKKANKFLKEMAEEYEKSFTDIDFWWQTIVQFYEEHGLTEEIARENAICAYILKNGDYDFQTKYIKTPFWEG